MKRNFQFLIAGIALVLILVTAGIFTACGAAEVTHGSLTVDVAPAASIKTIDAPIPMTCAEYLVTVTGGPTVLDPVTISGSSATFDKVLPGEYTVNVVGKNSAGDAIGEGENTVTVQIGLTNTCAVTVMEYTDTPGDLHIDLSWEPLVVASPIWTIATKDYTGTESPMTVSEVNAGTGTALADSEDLAVGWHGVVGTLFDDTVQTSGFATLARIVNGRLSTGAVHVYANAASGALEVLIDTDFYEDLELTANVPESRFAIYPDQTINIALTCPEAMLKFWYRNGVQIAVDQNSYLMDADTMQEDQTFRFDVIAFSLDGRRAAALSWQVDREDFTDAMASIAGSARVGKTESVPAGPVKVCIMTDAGVFVESVFVGTAVNGGANLAYTSSRLPAGTYKAAKHIDYNANGLVDSGEYATAWITGIIRPKLAPEAVNFPLTIE